MDHGLVKLFRSDQDEVLKCKNLKCKTADVIFQKGMEFQYAMHILLNCNAPRPMDFLNQIEIKKISWNDMAKMYKVSNGRPITKHTINKPETEQKDREVISPISILEKTNRTLINNDIQTNKICLGLGIGQSRSCKKVHTSDVFCPLQEEIKTQQYRDLKGIGQHILGNTCLITSFKNISRKAILPLMF